MDNRLETLVSEWYEYRGYFVRRNVRVGRLARGGYECELDVVAFHPGTRDLVHIEPSMDALSWEVREQRFGKKFEAGRRYIPELFPGLEIPGQIRQVALLTFASTRQRRDIGGGIILLLSDLLIEIRNELRSRHIAKAAVPETFPLLRVLQFAAHFWPADQSGKPSVLDRSAKGPTSCEG